MVFVQKAALLLGLAIGALAVPSPQAQAAPAADSNACGVVSQAFTQQKRADPRGEKRSTTCLLLLTSSRRW